MTTPPRKPQGSKDSLRPFTDDQFEKILTELGGVEGRFLGHLSTVHQDVQGVRAKVDEHEKQLLELRATALESKRTHDAVTALDKSVRTLLESDQTQYQQLAALQQARRAGGAWGAIVSLITWLVMAYAASKLGLPLPGR